MQDPANTPPKPTETGGGDATSAVAELDDAGFDAWLGLWKSQVVVREVERALRAAGAPSPAGCEVLSRLAAAPEGRMRMQELARRCFVSKSGISQLVTQLAKQGLVERRGDPDNLRVTYAVLTERGREVLRGGAPAFLGSIREHFSRHLTGAELSSLTAITGKLIAAHGETPEGPDASETGGGDLFRIVSAPDPRGAQD